MKEFEDYPWTEESLVDHIEGMPFREDEDERHWKCDFCSRGVNYTGGCSGWMYLADGVLGSLPIAQKVNSNRPLTTLASYCEKCLAGNPRLLFPCAGYFEVRGHFELNDERNVEQFKITDVSPRDDGIPYDPVNLSEKITQTPFDAMAMMGDELWGPENMVTFYMSICSDVDIREIVNYKGEINPKVLGRVRKEFREHAERRAYGDSEKQFREEVQSNWDKKNMEDI